MITVRTKRRWRRARRQPATRRIASASSCHTSAGPSPSPSQLQTDTTSTRKPTIIDPGALAPWVPGTEATLDDIVNLGADTVRLQVKWQWVAPPYGLLPPQGFDPNNPEDPAYDFSWVDHFMRAAQQRGIYVYLQLGGPAPDWASNLRPYPDNAFVNNHWPKIPDFKDFVNAVATRYSGNFIPQGQSSPLPAPRYWSLWNEPNLPIELEPQFLNGNPYSPILYRMLFNAGSEAIQAHIPGAAIMFGETSPYGDGQGSMAPIPFLRGALCQTDYSSGTDACRSGPAKSAGFALHPYGSSDRPPFATPPADAVNLGNLDVLEGALRDASQDNKTTTRLPVYLTEYGYQSPDEYGNQKSGAVSLTTQASYIGLSEWIAQSDPQVRSSAHYLIIDDPADPDPNHYTFTSGLRFASGHEKPAYTAFRLPLAVRRNNNQVLIWGFVRPAPPGASVSILTRDGGGSSSVLANLTTDSLGMFDWNSTFVAGREWCVVWHQPGGQDVQGPWTPAYSF